METCKCRRFSFDTAHLERAPLGWQSQQAWVCDLCNRVHHAAPDRRNEVRGPKNARLSNAHIKRNGQHDLTWIRNGERIMTVEYTTYPRKIPMTDAEQQPLIFSLWELLMSKVTVILAPPAGPSDNSLEAANRERARYEGRGLAEGLAILMRPHMDSADAVVKAAVKKFKEPDYEVPGLGEHLWDPMKNADGSPRTFVAEPKAKPAARPRKTAASKPAPSLHLSDDERTAIKEAASSGLFDNKTLAGMFNTTETAIASVIGS